MPVVVRDDGKHAGHWLAFTVCVPSACNMSPRLRAVLKRFLVVIKKDMLDPVAVMSWYATKAWFTSLGQSDRLIHSLKVHDNR